MHAASPATTHLALGSEREASGPLLGTFAAEQVLPHAAAARQSSQSAARTGSSWRSPPGRLSCMSPRTSGGGGWEAAMIGVPIFRISDRKPSLPRKVRQKYPYLPTRMPILADFPQHWLTKPLLKGPERAISQNLSEIRALSRRVLLPPQTSD